MNSYHPYSIFPLGDAALTIDFGNIIQENINKKVLHLFHHLKSLQHPALLDLVPAYSSLTIYYNVLSLQHSEKTSFELFVEILEKLLSKTSEELEEKANYFEIPVCYSEKFAPDIQYLAEQNELTIEDVMTIHTSKTYKVYMLGFLPGFTYMGEVDWRIQIARKPSPVKLPAGAVGIAGKQTGIYPLDSPGGWQIIGRTPVRIFSKDKEHPVFFQPGDEVKFYSITEDEFENYQAGHS